MPDSTQQTGGTHVPISEKLDLPAEKAHALYNFFCNLFIFVLLHGLSINFVERIYVCIYDWK